MTLGYLERALVQALSAHALASTMTALVVAIIWRRVSIPSLPAAVAARRLFLLRVAPSAIGALASLLVLSGYALWEKHVEAEPVGPAALAAAAFGLLLLAAGAVRAVNAVCRTWTIRRTLVRASGDRLPDLPLPAYVVDSRFPIVALVGLIMARLFVARRVIESCTHDELAAVIAHEQAHASTRDNLRRLVMTAAPDLLAWLPVGRRIQDAWLHTAELAADEWAASRTDPLLLASALVKVVRLAIEPSGPLPASALYRGEPITERVHRLLEPGPPPPAPRAWPRWIHAAACVAALAAGVIALPAIHLVAERILKWGL
jgi:Zn-dependent protease with chaperone function